MCSRRETVAGPTAGPPAVATVPPVLRPSAARAAALAAACVLAVPATAAARTDDAVTIAGPDPAILALGGVAMAADGTGGAVWTRFEDGAPHVYAARYDGERWQAPQRVDAGQRFTSSSPRIGAADDGRLVVTWIQQGPPNQDSMYSAVVPRRSTRFLPPTLVDYTVGDGTQAFPTLAMAPNGAALVAYHRVTPTSDVNGLLGPEYVSDQVRVARFDGRRWSGLGVSMARLISAPPNDTLVRRPTADAAPRVAIGADGSAVVAWQEPDEQLVDRVWLRRLFGDRRGVVQPLGAQTDGGRPQRGAADAFDVAITGTGRAVAAVRQQPDPTERTRPPRVWLSQLDEPESGSGTTVGTPVAADAGDAPAGPPSLSLGGRFGLLAAWARDGTAVAAQGTGSTASSLTDLGPALDRPAPVATQGVGDRGVVASAASDGGGRVRIAELAGPEVVTRQDVAGVRGGPVGELRIAGPGNGNALVAFRQGGDDEGQIAVARVSAPPVPFLVEPPQGVTNARRPLITWTAPPNDPRPKEYTVQVDGRTVARKVYDRSLSVPLGALRDGRHRVRVLATSRTGGGDTATPTVDFATDRRRPEVAVTVKGLRVVVRVRDLGGKAASKVAPGGTIVDWNDESTTDDATGVASHRYEKPGRRSILIRAQDQAGNTVARRVRVVLRAPRSAARRADRPAARHSRSSEARR